jgi:hypothetical protein
MTDATGTQSRNEPEIGALKAELDAEKRRAAALEARNAALEDKRRASRDASGARRGHRFLVAILLVLGFVLTPVTIVVLFAHTEITDTGRYVSTIKPLASDPAVQQYTADQVTNQLFAQVDVGQYVTEALPPRAQVLAGPLTNALKSFTHEATLRVLESKAFQTLWVESNRAAHQQINDILKGSKSGAVKANDNGAVTLDLSVVAQRVKQRLESTGIDAFSRIPADRISGRITILESKGLYKARRGFQALNRIAFVLPILVFASFGGAILLSRNRRRGFIKAALAFTLGAAVLAVLLAVARGVYLDGATNAGIPHDAAASVYDTLIRLLQTSMRSVLAFSIVVVVVAVLAGPSRLGVWFRAKTRSAALWLGQQTDTAGWTALGPVPFVVEHKGGLRIAIAAIGFVVLFLWNRPTPLVILWLGLAALVLLAVIELLGRDLGRPSTAGPAPA